ncbi:MAG: hypothetical protein ACKVT2_07055 [Saprospiraceae bacterium]
MERVKLVIEKIGEEMIQDPEWKTK